MRMAFDLHGVVMYLIPVLAKYFREVVGFELDQEHDRFSFPYPDWYKPQRFGGDIARAISTMAVSFAKPVHGSATALRAWRDRGNDIVIITASAASTMDANKEWLEIYVGCPYEIHQVTHQEGKVKKLNELKVTHFVDDRFKTCNQLADHLEHVFLFDAPCNRGRTIPKANVTRVRSLKKVFNLCS